MAFDPYHKWLGIPAAEQPADHYRLLSIARFESDADVIEGAADRQMSYLRTFQTGQHSALSQKLLTELAVAKLCLLNPAKKAAYDAELRRQILAAQPAIRAARPIAVQPARASPFPTAPRAAREATLVEPDKAEAASTVEGRARRRPSSAWAPAAVKALSRYRARIPRLPTSFVWVLVAAMALPALLSVASLFWTKPSLGPGDTPRADVPPARDSQREPALTDNQPSQPPVVHTPEEPSVTSSETEIKRATEMARREINRETFVSMFNGRDLTGWKPHAILPDIWRVKDGVLVGSGSEVGYLYSERDAFANFHLRVEARVNDGGNGGVFFRSAFGFANRPDGYEAQINSSGPDTAKTGSLDGPSDCRVTVVTSPVYANEWFTLEVIAQENHFVVKINGQTTADGIDASRKWSVGHLALQVQPHNPQSVVEFRKIEICEKPPAGRFAVSDPRDAPPRRSSQPDAPPGDARPAAADVAATTSTADPRAPDPEAAASNSSREANHAATKTPSEKSISGVDDPAFQQWLKEVEPLPAEQQVAAVVKKLRELNPGFPGKVTQRIENGVVTELGLTAPRVVKNILPVRALRGLNRLSCRGSPKVCPLSDLSPLTGMKLSHLDCSFTKVNDLSPLKRMNLTSLNISVTAVCDLSPLKDAALTELICSDTAVTDLSELRVVPLKTLDISRTRVSDLSPLRGTPLESLNITNSAVRDLAPLKGAPLTKLEMNNTQVVDLSPLVGMRLTALSVRRFGPIDLSPLKSLPLQELDCYFQAPEDLEATRSISTLRTIGGRPAKGVLEGLAEAFKKQVKK